MEKYYKKPVSLFKCGSGNFGAKELWSFKLCLHLNDEERLHINIVQVVAPPTTLKKSKCKYSRELKEIQESFLRLGILIKIILLKNLSINHGFAFPQIQEVSKKDMRNQCAMQHNLS